MLSDNLMFKEGISCAGIVEFLEKKDIFYEKNVVQEGSGRYQYIKYYQIIMDETNSKKVLEFIGKKRSWFSVN